jgi:hypothetical protein
VSLKKKKKLQKWKEHINMLGYKYNFWIKSKAVFPFLFINPNLIQDFATIKA